MDFQISKSTDIHDYEILIRRRGEGKYASYCPQINQMLLGTEHEEVYDKMAEHIKKYVEGLQAASN